MMATEYTKFSNLLLDIESNIDSNKLDWYLKNKDNRVMPYWRVSRPGRVKRNWDNGEPIEELITVGEFMKRSGIDDLFRKQDMDIEELQAACINPWGFIGYQFGEPILIDLGYYLPVMEKVTAAGRDMEVPVYYTGALLSETWRHRRLRYLHYDKASLRWIIGTDVNLWHGTFTGQDGVWSKEDLRTKACQNKIHRRAVMHNLAILTKLFLDRSTTLQSHCKSGERLAGILAGAHLCGPTATVEHYLDGKPCSDEAGTSISRYLTAFASIRLDIETLVAEIAA